MGKWNEFMNDKSKIDKESKQANKAAQESADQAIEISSSMKLTQPANTVDNTVKNTVKKTETAKATDKNTRSSKATTQASATPISKAAIIACLLSLIAIAGVGGHFYWNQLQNNERLQHLSSLLQQNQQKLTQQLQDKITQSNQTHQQQLDQIRLQIREENQTTLAQLQQKLAQLTQQQPSDWLLHEAEYLIRVAARSVWLEKNTLTAISLLNDADKAIQALNDPQYLPLRQIIQEDISQLKQLPKLTTDEVILTLMALEHQVGNLTLAMVKVPESSDPEQDLTLSSDMADWRENIAKSWQIFINEFITIRRRTGSVKPLMSPEYQQNLRENLSLKIQTAIWATHQQQNDIYQQSLTDIQQWVKDYFDVENATSKHFIDVSEQLKTAIIAAEFPNQLQSLASIRQLLTDKNQPRLSTPVQSPEQTIPVQSTPVQPTNSKEVLVKDPADIPTKQLNTSGDNQPQEGA